LSRNRDRTGTRSSKPEVNSPPPQVLQQETSGFSFVVPTEFVELPSEGKYYPEGHPLHNTDSIEIKQMTAKEEDLLTSRTLLKKGVALERVLQNILVDRSINLDSLLVGDRNAIIVAMRVSGYGSDYNTQVTCPQCTAGQPYSFDLNSATIYHGEDKEDLQVTQNEDGTFDVSLPRTNVSVTFRLLTGTDEKRLANMVNNKNTRKTLEDNAVTTQLATMVVAVNGDSSQEAVHYFINNVPSIDARHLRLAYRLTAPNVDLTQNFACSECDHEQDMEVPLSADFFWPDR